MTLKKESIFKEYSEYPTTDLMEVKYLGDLGIRYNFVKVIDGATIYKYIKNKQLFEALSNYKRYN